MLILPGDPEFDISLSALPPNWKDITHAYSGQVAFVADADTGILRPANIREMDDYLYGGEYEDRLKVIGDDGLG